MLRAYGAFILIAVTLAVAWLDGSTTFFVPCVQDCGETFVAQHAVVNDRLYGAKYGLLGDHATIPDPDRRPLLYTHNVNLGSLVFALLDRLGLRELRAKQLVTLLAFGAGLYYVFLTVRYVTRSTAAAFAVLLLFCTEYAQVFTFALNALRAWHWLALFGLIYHVLRYVSDEAAGRGKHLLAMTFFTAMAFTVGYEFLAFVGLIAVLVTVLCGRSWMRAGTSLAWLGGSAAVAFGARQLQVISVLGFDFWLTDFIYSAAIKVTALGRYVSIPSMQEIDAYYQARGILRPFAAPAPLDQILLGLQRLLTDVTLPITGVGASASLLLAIALSVGLVTLWALRLIIGRLAHSDDASWRNRILSGLTFRDVDWIDANLTARFFVAVVLGLVGGLIAFGSISLSIYLKHQFPMTAAAPLVANGVLIALLVRFALARRPRGTAAIAALLLAVVLIADHAATQIQNRSKLPAMSVAWIPEVMQRQNATYAVSWIPSSVAGFSRNWVIGIQPGLEHRIMKRIRDGKDPFTAADLLEVDLSSNEDHRRRSLLRPDYWLYYVTDQKAEFQHVVPSCNRTFARRLLDSFLDRQETPKLTSIHFRDAARAGTFTGALDVTGRTVAHVEVVRNDVVLARSGLDCDSGEFAGVLPPVDSAGAPIHARVDAVSHSGQRWQFGEIDINPDKQPGPAQEPPPSRQPGVEDLIKLNRALPIAAKGPGFVLFDLRGLWSR